MQNRDSETWSTLYIVDEISQTQIARHFDGTLRLTVTDALLASRMDGETRPEVVVHFSPAALHALAAEWRKLSTDTPPARSVLHPLLTQFRWFLESAAKRHTYVCDYIWLPIADEIKHQDTVYLLFDTPTYTQLKQQALTLASELWPREFQAS
ncbi:hypothetical protein CCAX7_30110 [Capsulimonas corticalis]|uniref:Uncharacterized protein n=1 Tax=Capsulimonas corticalis TaxID=2219043 RepID=A0A402CSU9_9BACT|nr:hypothetical protein [Capsulimonas corticalis]BDI30960.1 hypothetical protein CCAX7_30110 [Capsulimonas corticalis]